MPKRLGELEQMILLAVLRLGDDAYGVGIREEIRDRTGRSVSAGGIYTILARMEEQGLVTSRLSETTHARGGRRRKFYQATPEGRRVMQKTWDALGRLAEGVLRTSEGG
jgi:PadR family transcriptional regulator PadR